MLDGASGMRGADEMCMCGLRAETERTYNL